MSVYKIMNENNTVYVGSTKLKLWKRQHTHNECLNNPKQKAYDMPLYKYLRELGISIINLILIENTTNENLKTLEQEYIDKLNPIMNCIRSIPNTVEIKKQQHRIAQNKYYEKNKNNEKVIKTRENQKRKVECEFCGKSIQYKSLNRHKLSYCKKKNI